MTQRHGTSDRPEHEKHQESMIVAMRRENARLRQRVAGLAALVDHYYGAYRESQSLLARRERDLAELRQRLDLTPVQLTSQRHEPRPRR